MTPPCGPGARAARRRAITGRGLAVGILLLHGAGCMPTPTARPTLELAPIDVGPPGSAALAPVGFLAGCWRGLTADGAGVYEESFSTPAAGVMLGTSRMWSGSTLRSFEYLTLRSTTDGIVLEPSPGGRSAGVSFRLTEYARGVVTFEAPEHDHPKRIIYALARDGGLTIRVDGGPEDPDPRAWRLERAGCAR